MLKIAVLHENALVDSYKYDGFILFIGRASENDIVLDALGVAKVHAQIELSAAGQWVVSDRGSRTGTCVNGNPLTGFRARYVLKDGDVIQIMKFNLEINIVEKSDDSREGK